MLEKADHNSKYYIFLTGISLLFVATVFLLLISFAIQQVLPPWYWEHISLHVSLQTAGAFMMLSLAIFLWVLKKLQAVELIQLWISCVWLSMGLLEGLHALTFVAERFIWLQSLITGIGGVLFALVWLPERFIQRICQNHQIVIAVVLAGISGLFLYLAIPLPSKEGWTMMTNLLNMIGGIGFFMAAWHFLHIQSPPSVNHLVFASHCLLLGFSTGLFQFAHLWEVWNATWGFWHLLRLAAYFTVLYYLIFLLRQIFTRLIAMEQRLHIFMEFAPVGIFYTDMYGAWSFMNKKGIEMTGLTAEDATGKGWIKAVHSDDRRKIIAQWHETFKNNQIFKSKLRFQHADGTIVWVFAEIIAELGAKGEIRGYLGILTEISELKKKIWEKGFRRNGFGS